MSQADGMPGARGAADRFPLVNLLLFLLTLCTTMVAGAYLSHFDHDIIRFWVQFKYHWRTWTLEGLPFAVSLMAILVSHEFGHFLMSRHHSVRCSLPYFLPGPNLVGTFGAVIFMKSSIPHRRALFDIGAAGPLTGLAVAVFTMVLGFATAEVEVFQARDFPHGMVLFHPNLLLHSYLYVWEALSGSALPENAVISSPLLDAACVGFLVTMLNLLPVGQLDGGHVAYAALGRRSFWLGLLMLAAIIFMGVMYWVPWFFLAGLLFLLMGRRGFKHPPPLDPHLRLDRGRQVLAGLVLVLFIFIVSPAPVDVYIPGVLEEITSITPPR